MSVYNEDDHQSLAIIPNHRKSSGLTPVPTFTMRTVFLPVPDNHKYDGQYQIAYQSTSKMGNIRIKSSGLNVSTDFPVFAKLMQSISNNDCKPGDLIRIPYDEFIQQSIHVDLNHAGRSKERLIRSFERLQSLTVTAFNGEISQVDSVTKWMSLGAFPNLGFDLENNVIFFECNHQLREWYADSFRQVLVKQFNQIETNYGKSLYLYMESIYENGTITIYIEYLRDLWFLSRFKAFKDPNKRRTSERNVERQILKAVEEISQLQYFEFLHIDKFTNLSGEKKTRVRFKKQGRRVRNRVLTDKSEYNANLTDEDLLLNGLIVKPVRSRLPKRPFKFENASKTPELIEWANDSLAVLTEHHQNLMAFHCKGLEYKDKAKLKIVTDFLTSHNVKFEDLDKSIEIQTTNELEESEPLKQVEQLEIKKQRLIESLELIESEIICKCRGLFDIEDSAELSIDSDEVKQFLRINKKAQSKLVIIKSELELVEVDLNE